MGKFYAALFALFLAFVTAGCGGGGGGGASTDTASAVTITGYVEDDLLPFAEVTLMKTDGTVLTGTSADENASYSLSAKLARGTDYLLRARAKLKGTTVQMHAVFTAAGTSRMQVNIHPLSDIVYRVGEQNGIRPDEAEDRVQSYFRLFEKAHLHEMRYTSTEPVVEKIGQLAKSFGSLLPAELTGDIADDVVGDGTRFRSRLAGALRLEASGTRVPVGETVTLHLAGISSLSDDIRIVWSGLGVRSDDGTEAAVRSEAAAYRIVEARLYRDGRFLDSASAGIVFYDVRPAVSIPLQNGGAKTEVDGIGVEVPPEAAAGLDAVSLAPVENPIPGVLRTVRMSPGGSIFARPVTLTFSYDPQEIENPAAMTVTRLETDGTLEVLKKEVDIARHTLTVRTDHFSDISIYTDPNYNDSGKARDSLRDIDPEDDLFLADGSFGISMMPAVYFGDFVEYMTKSSSPLNETARSRMTRFHQDVYKGIDNVRDNYVKVSKYILAERSGPMYKYETLVDALKKFRIARMIDEYLKHNMLIHPYRPYLNLSTTTRADFFNEIVNVQNEQYGMDSSYDPLGNKIVEMLADGKEKYDFLKSSYVSYLEKGYMLTGSMIAWDTLKNYVLDEIKNELTKHFTNKELSYLQCFSYNDNGVYWIGEQTVFILSDDGSVTLDKKGMKTLDLIGTLIEEKKDNIKISNSLLEETYLFDRSDAEKKAVMHFADCVYRKANALDESNVLNHQNDFVNGILAVSKQTMINETYNEFDNFHQFLKDRNILDYLYVLKIINFDAKQLQEYSKYLKTLAVAAAEPILTEIMVEKKLIESDKKYEDLKKEDVGFFNDLSTKVTGLIKWHRYYRQSNRRSLPRGGSEDADTVTTAGIMPAAKLLAAGLSIPEKYMNNLTVDEARLSVRYIPLEKKFPIGNVESAYYESAGGPEEHLYTVKNIARTLYRYNTATKRYDLPFSEMYPDFSPAEPTYLDATIELFISYRGRHYRFERSFERILDSGGGVIVAGNTKRYTLHFSLRGADGKAVENAKVTAGRFSCVTDGNGQCDLTGLPENIYTVTARAGNEAAEKNILVDRDGLAMTLALSAPLNLEKTMRGKTFYSHCRNSEKTWVEAVTFGNDGQMTIYSSFDGETKTLRYRFADNTLITVEDGREETHLFHSLSDTEIRFKESDGSMTTLYVSRRDAENAPAEECGEQDNGNGEQSGKAKTLLAGKTFYGIEERDGAEVLVRYDFDSGMTRMDWQEIEGGSDHGSHAISTEGDIVTLTDGGQKTYLRIKEADNGVTVEELDVVSEGEVIIGVNDTRRLYNNRSDVPWNTTLRFTQEDMDGKTFYLVKYDDFGYDDEGEPGLRWNMARMAFTSQTVSWTEYDVPDTSTHTFDYTVTDKGEISIGGGFSMTISLQSQTDNYLKVCANGDCDTYLFFSQSKARTFRDSHNSDNAENSGSNSYYMLKESDIAGHTIRVGDPSRDKRYFTDHTFTSLEENLSKRDTGSWSIADGKLRHVWSDGSVEIHSFADKPAKGVKITNETYHATGVITAYY